MNDTRPDEINKIWITTSDEYGKIKIRSYRGSSNPAYDYSLIDRAWMFRYAARRQNKVLIIDMVPRWKAWILSKVFRVELCKEPDMEVLNG